MTTKAAAAYAVGIAALSLMPIFTLGLRDGIGLASYFALVGTVIGTAEVVHLRIRQRRDGVHAAASSETSYVSADSGVDVRSLIPAMAGPSSAHHGERTAASDSDDANQPATAESEAASEAADAVVPTPRS